MINIPCESDALKNTYIIEYLYFSLLAKERHQKTDFQSILIYLPKRRYQKVEISKKQLRYQKNKM